MISTIDKAITAFVVPAIITGIDGILAHVGITGQMTVGTVVTSLVTGFFVWLIPNKAK